MITTSKPNQSADFSWFIASLAISPVLFLAGTFAGAFGITQLIVPGTTGAEALVLSAVIVGLLGGFGIARFNPNYGLPAALYSASFSGMLYLSVRMFWLDAPINLMSSGFLLIIPAALLGAYTAARITSHAEQL